jgi:hypothetical protein
MINQSILSIERSISTQAGSVSITGAASGVPTGGTAGQILAKQSNNNYDTHWINQQASNSEFLLQTVYNGPGSTINKGEVVYIVGAQGTSVTVDRAIASFSHDSEVIGVALDNILSNQTGRIVIHGIINGLNTDSFSEGDRLYLSAVSYGQITNVQPSAPNHAILIGYCVKKGITDGSIYVNVNDGQHLKELHDVNIDSAISGQYLFLDNDQIWKNKTIEYTDVSGLTGILSGLYPRSNPSGYISGDLSLLYPRSNPSGFITGIQNLVYTTGDQSIAGNKVFENLVQASGLEVGTGNQAPTFYIEEGRVGINTENPTSALEVSGLAKFSERPSVNGTGVLLSGEVDTSTFYPRSNPSGFITGMSDLVYTTGDQVISGLKTFSQGISIEGDSSLSALFVSGQRIGINNENPQASLDISGSTMFSERPTVNGTGVLLSGDIDTSILYPNLENLVYTTGDQVISGLKTFSQGISIEGDSSLSALFVSGQRIGINNENPQASLDISGSTMFSERPTVNGTGVLLEGEIQNNTIISGVVYSAQVNVKNGEGGTIYKGQPVYIKGADGSNIIIGLASNTGEETSSKTLGLVVQDSLAQNALGTVITDGLLQGFDASTANAGDSIWLGPTGSLIYGSANKPYAPDHLVYLGVVTRAQNNGELFVKVQNGYELDELHDVNVTGVSSGQFLFRNNNLWSGKNLSISDVSNLQSSLDSKQITGDYYASSNPSGFISSVSQFNYISGDLTGSLLSPSLSYIQGNAISAASPSAGQTLQWNGTAWVPGSIPNGGNGGGGIPYYFNFANTSGIAPVSGLPTSPVAPSQLGRSYSVGSGSITSTDLTQGSYSLICGFVTPAADPGVTDIPAGLWDFNIWCDILGGTLNSNQTQFQIRVYKYNSTTQVYTSIANSDDVFVYDPITIAQYIGNVTIPQTTILATDRIYVELWAQKNVNATRQIRFYFDSLHPSHVHTTLPSVAGNGIVKVINGVMQSPAGTIVDADVSPTAGIAVSKLSGTGIFYAASNPSGFITGVNLSNYVTNSQTGAFYAASNPSGFITGVNLSNYVTNSQTGAFYAASNPSGYIGSAVLSNYVTATGNHTISGILTFTDPPLETKATASISAGTLTLNMMSASLFYVNLNAAITTFTLQNVPASPAVHSFTLQFVGDASARAVTWPVGTRWAGGTNPTLTSTLNKVDTFTFMTHDGGTNWFAFVSNQNQ